MEYSRLCNTCTEYLAVPIPQLETVLSLAILVPVTGHIQSHLNTLHTSNKTHDLLEVVRLSGVPVLVRDRLAGRHPEELALLCLNAVNIVKLS